MNTLDERSFLRHGTAHRAEDMLTSPAVLAAWFGEHDLPAAAGPADLDAARSLRSALRSALLDEGPVDDALARFPVRLAAAGGGLRLVAYTGCAGIDALVETVATSVADGRWKRLRLCASEDCRWAFHDTSRSGGGRWCSMEVCGNRHKTRAYRQRRSG
jgi:predicted RNA-binding Zn ribbon-like protein